MLSRIFNPQNVSLALLALGFMGVFLFPIGSGAKTEEIFVTCEMCKQPANAAESGDMIALSETAKNELKTMLDAYFVIGDELASDSVENVNTKANEMLEAFDALEQEVPAEFWDSHKERTKAVRDSGDKLAEASDIKTARIAYGSLSEAVDHLTAAIGVPTSDGKPVYKYICGMASDMPHGGVWLQKDKPARNPYFGHSMLRCHSDAIEVPAAVTKEPSPETPE